MPKNISEMQLVRNNRLTQCADGKPLITFGGGDAPVLNYRMPQSTSFTTYGNILLGVGANNWTDKAKQQYSNADKAKSIAEIAASIVKETTSVYTTKGLLNSRLIESFNNLSESEHKIEAEKIAAIKSTARTASAATIDETMLLKRATFLAEKIKENFVAVSTKKFNGQEIAVEFIKRPTTPQPRIFIIEEYKTISFLGNYGAGKTINTFTLLPGEKTTIFVKTFKEISEIKTSASNIVDSFTKESADEMENLMESENATSDAASSADSLMDTSPKQGQPKCILRLRRRLKLVRRAAVQAQAAA